MIMGPAELGKTQPSHIAASPAATMWSSSKSPALKSKK